MRFWTVDEAREYLPRLRQLLERIREVATRPVRVRANGNAQITKGATTESAREALGELASRDIVLRDPQNGLIDFPAKGEDGVVYFICWCFDDGDDLGWWHLPDEGFPGRKPLPRES